MRIFYICLLCSVGSYHISYFLRRKWRKSGRNRKSKSPSKKPQPPVIDTNQVTFENEKVLENQLPEDDDEY